MSVHLSEEEQLEALKRWWNDNGKQIVAVVVVALVGFFGWNQYQNHKEKQTQENSMVYQKLSATVDELEQATDEEIKQAKQQEVLAVAQELADEQSATLYGDFAQLYLAKIAADKQDWQSAKAELKKVSDAAENSAIKDLAQLRLARVLAAEGDADGALEILKEAQNKAFASLYAEASGDIYVSKGELENARQAFQKATDSLDANDFMRRSTLRMKLDNTLVASDQPEISPQSPNPHAAAPAGDA